MASVAHIFNVPGTPEELASWAFNHMGHHRDINKALYNRSQVVLQEFVLDPWNPTLRAELLFQHQQMHNAINQQLSLNSGYNLIEVDWDDPAQRAAWCWLNGTEHQAFNNQLGV